jgi:hypothetical protein
MPATGGLWARSRWTCGLTCGTSPTSTGSPASVTSRVRADWYWKRSSGTEGRNQGGFPLATAQKNFAPYPFLRPRC